MTNLIKKTQLTRQIILDQIALMILDHQLEISKDNLEKKINLLFDDCKNLSAEAFIENCRILRKQEMFGKLPPNFKFIDPIFQGKKDLAAQINEIAGVNYVDKVIIEGDLTKIKCKSPASQANFCELSEDKKTRIKALISGKIEVICC